MIEITTAGTASSAVASLLAGAVKTRSVIAELAAELHLAIGEKSAIAGRRAMGREVEEAEWDAVELKMDRIVRRANREVLVLKVQVEAVRQICAAAAAFFPIEPADASASVRSPGA